MGDTNRRYTIEYRASGDAPTKSKAFADVLVGLNLQLESGTALLRDFSAAVKAIPGADRVAKISSVINAAGIAAERTTKDVAELASSLGSVGSKAPEVSKLRDAVQQLQRTTYGASQNAADASKNYAAMGASATTAGTALKGVATNLPAVSGGLNTANTAAGGLGLSLGQVVGAFAGFMSARQVLGSIGEALTDARDRAISMAEGALQLRDNLRELANLKQQAGPNDLVVGEHLKLRVDSGMDQKGAQKFQEQFLGSLPLAKDKGGITDAVAEPFSRKVAALAVRTGLDGGTAGDLAGVMGSFGKISSANEGLGKTQQIVDQLNDGRGNLTPLTKELLKNAAGTVSEGGPFPLTPGTGRRDLRQFRPGLDRCQLHPDRPSRQGAGGVRQGSGQGARGPRDQGDR